MSQGIASFLSVNRTVTNLGGELRHLRLPRMNPFPKLDRQTLPAARPVTPLVRRGTVIIEGGAAGLPEMVTDVVQATQGCAVENVRRNPVPGARRARWAQLLGWRR